MRVALIALLVAGALTLGGCRGVREVADDVGLLCTAAQSWIRTDPADRKRVTRELSAVIAEVERSVKGTPSSPTARSVLNAAKQLVSGKRRQVAQAARKIEKFC